MIQHDSLWLADFTQLSSSDLRLAHYALQLVQIKTETEQQWHRENFLDPLWKILRPLLTPQGVRVLLGLDPEADDAQVGQTMPSDNEEARHRLRRCCHSIPQDVVQRLQQADQTTPVPAIIQILRDSLDLDQPSMALLNWVYHVQYKHNLRKLLMEHETGEQRSNVQRLAAMLSLSEATLRQTLQQQSPLRHLGLIHLMSTHDCYLDDFVYSSDLLIKIFSEEPQDSEALMRLLIEPAPLTSLPLTAFPHLRNEAERLLAALRHSTEHALIGINALFYGQPGTGKTELARAIIQASGLQAWQVRSANEDHNGLSRDGRLSAYLLAQHLLGRHQKSVLIFDEIEDVFDDRSSWSVSLPSASIHGLQKGWMNRILEDNAVPAIWITNEVQRMDPAFIRRFLLPVAFKTPPRSVRQQMVSYHLGDTQVPPDVLDELANDAVLTPAQFRAARCLLELHPHADPATTVREGVGALRAVLHGSALSRQRRVGTAFDLAFLNLAGQDTPQAIVQALNRQGQGSVCFSGPPGTGKTAFAEILATVLDRELITQSASDLISPYIGESEKNLAALFQNHDPSQAILFLDEVDSFLSERRTARHSWERTAVNELLQQMERYPGIFLAATNLIERVDQAALRRFDFKLQFRPLNTQQRRALLARETLGDKEQPLPAKVTSLLDQLNQLTPGDFATVHRQQQMLGATFTPEEFLQRLMQEQRWKHNARAQAHPQSTIGNHF